MIANIRFFRFRYLLAAGLLISFFSLSGYFQIVSSKLPIDQTEQLDKPALAKHSLISIHSWKGSDTPLHRPNLAAVFQDYCLAAFETGVDVRFSLSMQTNFKKSPSTFVQNKTIPSSSKEPAHISLIG